MEFKRILQCLLLTLIPIYLVTGCGDLEPEMQDTRTVILKMDFDQRSSSRTSSVSEVELSQYNTHLILALPSGENLTSSYEINSSFAQGLMNTADNTVSLAIPLNKLDTEMKIFAFLFQENYSTLSDFFSGTRTLGYHGESESFYILHLQDPLDIPLQVPGTGTGGGSDNTAPTVTFSPANGATVVPISNNITITFSEAVRNIDNTVLMDSNIDSLITLKLTNAIGANITFDATIDANMKVITINPISNLFYSQAVYVAIGSTVEDAADNPITAANATFTTTMDPSLEAFYPFNGNANDESGNSFHGQLGNNSTSSTLTFPTLTTDRYGNADKAFSFDGDDWIALDKYVTPNSISEITVCAWALSTDNTSNKFIISFDRSESYRLALKDGGNTYVGWDTTDSNGSTTTHDLRTSGSYSYENGQSYTIEDGNWHHICGWFNKSSTVDKKIFIDGVPVASNSNTHSGRNLGTSDRTRHYGFIGWGSEASSFNDNGNVHQDDFMIGKIDDVRIYSRSLSDEEISSLYLSEKP